MKCEILFFFLFFKLIFNRDITLVDMDFVSFRFVYDMSLYLFRNFNYVEPSTDCSIVKIPPDGIGR